MAGACAHAATAVNSCPTNTTAYTIPTGAILVALSADCPSGTTAVFTTTGCSDESAGACEHCGSGSTWNHNGVCATMCPIKSTARLTGGAVVPLWQTLATMHGLHIAFGAGNENICHVNMDTGTATNTLHVKTGDNTVYNALLPVDPGSLGHKVCVPQYSVTYNCGTGATGTAPDAQTVTLGYPFTVADYGSCAKLGHTANGWNINSTTYASTAPSFIWNTQSGAAAVLQWTADTYQYRYLCDIGAAVSSTANVLSTNSYTVNYTGCTKTGHTLNNWGTSTETTSITNAAGTYTNGNSITPANSANTAQNLYFIATWTPNDYTASYSCNGGTGTAPASASVTYGDSYTLAANTCTKSDSWYLGWTNSGTTYQPGDTYNWTSAGNQTFSASWLTKYDPTINGSTSSGNASANTWSATFSYGTVNGTSRCSTETGSFTSTLRANITNDGGKWCWCKMAQVINGTNLESMWTPLFGYSSDTTENASADSAMCAANCATHCGYMMINYSTLRTTMYNSIDPETGQGINTPSLSAPYSVNTNTYGYQNDSRGEWGADSSDCTGCNDNEWHADFSYGTVTGIASCNSTPGDNQDYTWTNPTTVSSDSMSSSSTGQYCWCKMTGFAGQSLSVAPWVFNGVNVNADRYYNASGVINSEE